MNIMELLRNKVSSGIPSARSTPRKESRKQHFYLLYNTTDVCVGRPKDHGLGRPPAVRHTAGARVCPPSPRRLRQLVRTAAEANRTSPRSASRQHIAMVSFSLRNGGPSAPAATETFQEGEERPNRYHEEDSKSVRTVFFTALDGDKAKTPPEAKRRLNRERTVYPCSGNLSPRPRRRRMRRRRPE